MKQFISKHIYTIFRYFIALVILFYGFAKINEAQFTILTSELDKPLGEVSGFWLTWYYFGYSTFYGNFVAFIQIVAGVLLLFRRTTLLGACILFGIVGNIILVDIFFEISRSALVSAILLEAGLTYIIWQHRIELMDIFWRAQNSFYDQYENDTIPKLLKAAIRSVIIILPFIGTYFIANFNNRLTTPVDGKWAVIDSFNNSNDTDRPSHLYFEKNRRHLSVFRYDDRWEYKHFEIDEENKSMEIWDGWNAKSNKIFSGKYKLEGDTLLLRGNFQGDVDILKLIRSD